MSGTLFQAWHLWAAAGLVLWIAEVFVSGFVLGIFGVGCFASAALSAYDQPLVLQVLGFAVTAIVLLLFVRPIMLHHFHPESGVEETNVDALCGMSGTVVERIDPAGGGGRVKVGSEEWKAASSGGSALEAGSEVVVEKVEGCTVYVAPVPPPE